MTSSQPAAGSFRFTRLRAKWRRLIDVTSWFITLVALGFATKQLYDSRQQTAALERIITDSQTVQKSLANVAGLMATQSIGLFPENMGQITSLIGSTKKRLRIMVDVGGYGLFSAPEESEAYDRALLEVRRRLGPGSVTMLVYSAEAYRHSIESQFKPGDFEQLLQSDKYRHFFDDLEPRIPKPKTEREFIQFVASQESDRRKGLISAGIDLRGVDSFTAIPFFVWLRDTGTDDDKRRTPMAILSLYNIGDNVREVSFSTTAATLLDAVQDSFAQALALSKPLTLDAPLGISAPGAPPLTARSSLR